MRRDKFAEYEIGARYGVFAETGVTPLAWSDLVDWLFWEHVGKVAPMITAMIALGAAWLALSSLRTQKRKLPVSVLLSTFFLKPRWTEKC
jgi:hypothetical protein